MPGLLLAVLIWISTATSLYIPNSSPESLLIPGFFAHLVGYLTSWWVVVKFFSLGQELRVFRLFDNLRLACLAFRTYWLYFLIVFLAVPASIAGIVYGILPHGYKIDMSFWLLAIDLILISSLYLVTSIFMSLVPRSEPLSYFGIRILIPLNLAGNPYVFLPVIILLAFSFLLNYLFVGFRALLDRFIETAAHSLVWAIELDGIGALIGFIFSPYYLLATLCRQQDQELKVINLVVFAIIVLVVLAIMISRIRVWLREDLKEASKRSFEFYRLYQLEYYRIQDQQLQETRDQTQSVVTEMGELNAPPEISRSSQSVQSSSASVDLSEQYDSAIDEHGNIDRADSSNDKPIHSAVFRLPQDKNPEVFAQELWPLQPVWPHKYILATLVLPVMLIPYWGKQWISLVPLIWLLISGHRGVVGTFSSEITAQRAFPWIWWRIKRYAVRFIPMDFLVACVIPVVATQRWYYFLPCAISLLTVRVFLILFTFMYHLQRRGTALLFLALFLAHLYVGAATFFTQFSGDRMGFTDSVLLTCVILIPHILAWLWITVLIQWRYNGLIHRESIR